MALAPVAEPEPELELEPVLVLVLAVPVLGRALVAASAPDPAWGLASVQAWAASAPVWETVRVSAPASALERDRVAPGPDRVPVRQAAPARPERQ